MTKYIKGVALATFDEQRAGGDKHPVHPDAIVIRDQHVPVSLNFDTATTLGMTTHLYRADDRIMFEAEIDESKLPAEKNTAAIGYTLNEYTSDKRLIPGGRIHWLGLVEQHRNENANQPPFEFYEPAQDLPIRGARTLGEPAKALDE